MPDQQASTAGGATSDRLMSVLIDARDTAEQHLENPDNSTFSATGMIRHLADALTTFIDQVSAEWENVAQPVPDTVTGNDSARFDVAIGFAGGTTVQIEDQPADRARQFEALFSTNPDIQWITIEQREHEHHFPLGPNPENDPALYPLDCACGLTYQDYDAGMGERIAEGLEAQATEVEPAPDMSALMSRALCDIFERMTHYRSGGDERSAEFLAEEWDHLVPEPIRSALNIEND